MKITLELTPDEVTKTLTDHFSHQLAIDADQIHIEIADRIDVSAVLRLLIEPLVASPDQKIAAIKALRAICPSMRLISAKWAVENYDEYLAACYCQSSLLPSAAPK